MLRSTAMAPDKVLRAWQMLEEAYSAQMDGDYDHAAELYQESLAIHPTAEAHTFLGWTLHFQGKIEEAIEECKRAIEVDPDFGNPYNDIGAYLISLGRLDEAKLWLERAIEAPRYEPRHFPHYNLGRIYVAKGMLSLAQVEFQTALRIEPCYALAQQALEHLRRMVN